MQFLSVFFDITMSAEKKRISAGASRDLYICDLS